MSRLNREEILTWVADVLVNSFDVERDSITLEADLVGDLELDSLDAIDMIVLLEKISGRRIEDAALEKVLTVGDIVDLAERHLGWRDAET